MDPLLSELGQSLPLSEEQLEEVRGETSTALYVSQTQLLKSHTHTFKQRPGRVVNTTSCLYSESPDIQDLGLTLAAC